MKKLTANQNAFVALLREDYASGSETSDLVVSKSDIMATIEKHGTKYPSWLTTKNYRVGTGEYTIPALNGNAIEVASKKVVAKTTPAPVVEQPIAAYHAVADNVISIEDELSNVQGVEDMEEINYVPEKNKQFIKFGNYKSIDTIVKSNKFFPTFITGLSGNGKTFSVEQACAHNKREYIPVSITIETDESDLIGDLTLENGNIKWVDGPVITAMKRGAVLLLDEIDLASNKIMSLQSIIDGKGIFLKKIKKFIKPAEGFTVFATANTKGKGSEDGRFIGTNILNEAFLERFKITLEQDYPTPSVEKKILAKVFESLGVNDDEYIEKLTTWSDIIRKSFNEGAIDEIITTRRLVHIAETYAIFDDRMTAIEMCTNRFDDNVKESFMELYANLDEKVREAEVAAQSEYNQGDDSVEIPF